VGNYFNSTSFPNHSLPTVTSAWVSASGLNNSGVVNAGSAAQRQIIVDAMRAAVDSNTDAIEDVYSFNLLCVPGYPEVTENLVNLNNNRSNTGFVIADTPLTLPPDVVTITQWINNANGNGLPAVTAADPYTAVYYPSGLTNDLSGNTVAVPASHAVLRTFMYNDNQSYVWFAPAGTTRGVVSNFNDVGYVDATTGSFVHNGINQGLRDALYPLRINPIAQLPNVGIVVWGQKTRYGGTSSRSSVNVVRLENYLRTIFKTVANGYLFEPNDTITRKSIASQIEGALHDVLSKRGIYDFLVICDSSNNTSTTIANQQLYVDVAIEPMRDVEFIYIPIALYNPGEITKLHATST
jgi:phage tail sheath protein FI